MTYGYKIYNLMKKFLNADNFYVILQCTNINVRFILQISCFYTHFLLKIRHGSQQLVYKQCGINMTKSDITAHVIDQRCAERIAIGEEVEFRCNADEDFRTATMVDFSETGMLLLMKEEFSEGAKFEVRVKEEEAIFFTVTCVRITPCEEVNLFGYGCKIEKHHIES